VLGRGEISQVQDAGDSETEGTVSVADPVGFTSAFGKLEQAIGELVGAGDVKERLKIATMTLVPIFPDDFPAGHLRDEYADIRQALTWLPPGGGERARVAGEHPRGHDGRGGRGPGEESVLAVHVCGRGRVRRLARALGPFTAPRLRPDGRGDLRQG
jgi:hypothetical protein